MQESGVSEEIAARAADNLFKDTLRKEVLLVFLKQK
jgi:hypothetical protein